MKTAEDRKIEWYVVVLPSMSGTTDECLMYANPFLVIEFYSADLHKDARTSRLFLSTMAVKLMVEMRFSSLNRRHTTQASLDSSLHLEEAVQLSHTTDPHKGH